MAQTGLQLRRDTKANLLLTSVRVGEIVYAEDTEEIGMYLNGTMEWTKIGTSGVPDGGTTDQVLTKLSATNGDATWSDPAAGGGSLFASQNTASTNSNYYDNEFEMFTFNYINDAEVTIKYDVTVQIASSGTDVETFSGMSILPASLFANENNAYAVDTSVILLNPAGDNGANYTQGQWVIRLQKNTDNTCLLVLHDSSNNVSNVNIFITYEILYTNFGVTNAFRYVFGA